MTGDGCEVCRKPKAGHHLCDACLEVINTPPVREDYLDYPTAWRIQGEGLIHVDPQCSAFLTANAVLCDCGALAAEWARRVRSQERARQ